MLHQIWSIIDTDLFSFCVCVFFLCQICSAPVRWHGYVLSSATLLWQIGQHWRASSLAIWPLPAWWRKWARYVYCSDPCPLLSSWLLSLAVVCHISSFLVTLLRWSRSWSCLSNVLDRVPTRNLLDCLAYFSSIDCTPLPVCCSALLLLCRWVFKPFQNSFLFGLSNWPKTHFGYWQRFDEIWIMPGHDEKWSASLHPLGLY